MFDYLYIALERLLGYSNYIEPDTEPTKITVECPKGHLTLVPQGTLDKPAQLLPLVSPIQIEPELIISEHFIAKY